MTATTLDELRVALAYAQVRLTAAMREKRRAITFAGRMHWAARVEQLEREVNALIAAKRREMAKVER